MARDDHLRRYNMTEDDFQQRLAAQGGVCAVCHKLPSAMKDGRSPWQVDHDHACCSGPTSCGKCVRGILCFGCNRYVLPVVERGLHWQAEAYLAEYAARRSWDHTDEVGPFNPFAERTGHFAST